MKSMFVAVVVACLSLSSGAHAQTKPKASADEAKAQANLTKGMSMAPAMITAAQLSCTPTAANFLFSGESDSDGKKVAADFVEVACQNNLGYVLASQKDGAATNAFDCISTAAKLADGKDHSLKCALPANANPARTLQPVLDAANIKCAIDKGAAVGMTAKALYYELSCDKADGILLGINTPRTLGTVVATTCYQSLGTARPCTLTSAEQSIAPVMALAPQGDKGCAATRQRYMGRSKTGDLYYEFACPDGSGLVVETKAGAFSRSIPCALATGVVGGCTLTASTPPPATAFKTEKNAIYTQLAKQAGFNCDVEKYGVFPRPQSAPANREVIELVCTNRADGGVGIFGDTNNVLNCVQSRVEGYMCTGSKEAAAYARITDDLKSKGRGNCQVNDARIVGATAENDYVEVSCANGVRGFIVAYASGKPVLIDATHCALATELAGGCKLPANAKHES